MSYIVLSFNHVRFVRQAIESILAQDYPAIELIVVDDGSTDGSAELLRALSTEMGFRLVEKKNGGVVSALHVGLSFATGEFVVPHASDDISHPGRTRIQVDLLRENGDAGFAAGGIRKIDSSGELLAPHGGYEFYRFRFDDFRTGRASVPAVSCIYRAEAIRAALPLDETLSFEDVQLYWRVTELGWTCLYDNRTSVVDYRILPQSLGRSNKVRLCSDFSRFIQRYREKSWYPELVIRANSGMFVQLAASSRMDAIRFLFWNVRLINSKSLLRGCAVIAMPVWLQKKLRRSY